MTNRELEDFWAEMITDANKCDFEVSVRIHLEVITSIVKEIAMRLPEER